MLNLLAQFLPRLLEIRRHPVALLGDGRILFPAALPQRFELRLDRVERGGLFGDLLLQRLAFGGELCGVLGAFRAHALVKFDLLVFLREFLADTGEIRQHGVPLLHGRACSFIPAIIQRRDFLHQRREFRVLRRHLLMQRIPLGDHRLGFPRLLRAEIFVLFDVLNLRRQFSPCPREFVHRAVTFFGDHFPLGGKRLGLPFKFRLGFGEF